MFAYLYLFWSFSSLVLCHSLNNLLFSDTACCTASFHHHDSFSRYFPGVDSPNSSFASCIILEYVSFQFVSFPSAASNEQRCSLVFEMNASFSSSWFNFHHRVRLVLSLGLVLFLTAFISIIRNHMLCCNWLPVYHFAVFQFSQVLSSQHYVVNNHSFSSTLVGQ